MGSELKVNKGAALNTASSSFVVKGSNTFINIDNADLNPANGIVLQLMDSDMPNLLSTRYVIPIGEEDEPITGRDLTKADPKEDVFMTLSNMEITGDFYNSTTNLKANCRDDLCVVESDMTFFMPEMDAPLSLPEGAETDMEARQGVKNLDLRFTNVKVKGVISAAKASYRDGVTVIDVSNNKELGAITQTACEPVNNGVIVSLDKDCVWTVTGTSYLTSLTVIEGAVIQAPKGKKLIMTVDGEDRELVPDTYNGKIVMKVI
jgi:hypothetical protein